MTLLYYFATYLHILSGILYYLCLFVFAKVSVLLCTFVTIWFQRVCFLLTDTSPELQYTFIEQALRGGPAVSLRCTAAGAPPPRFQWMLDGQPLTAMSRGLR